jgi:hypothetical protein
VTPLARGLAVAALQVAIVAGVGGKLLLDRATLPRAWTATASYDPVLPIRGRYASLNLVVDVRGLEPRNGSNAIRPTGVALAVRDGRLTGDVRAAGTTGPGLHAVVERRGPRGAEWILAEPVLYFIPEHAADPAAATRRGEPLWAEVTVPPQGAPRPIRLGLRYGDRIEPLAGFD